MPSSTVLAGHDWLGALPPLGSGPARAARRRAHEPRARAGDRASSARAATGRSSSTAPPRTSSSPSSQRLHDAGARFTAVSEERGDRRLRRSRACSSSIDPIDGSLNAKRGLAHHALSIAVADGPTMADVRFGYVYDVGAGEEWRAESRRRRVARRRRRWARCPPSAGRPTGGWRSWRSSPPRRSAWPPPCPRWRRAPTGCARSGRSRSRSARSRAAASTRWPRSAAAARSTPRRRSSSSARPAALVAFPSLADPLGAPLADLDRPLARRRGAAPPTGLALAATLPVDR